MAMSLFGLLILDRQPAGFADFLGLLQAWLQDAGGFAALGLAVYLLYAMLTPAEQAQSAKARIQVTPWMLGMAVLALLSYAVFFFFVLTDKGIDRVNVYRPPSTGFVKQEVVKFSTYGQPLLLMFGGLFALLGIGQPFAASLAKVRFRRIWALTQLGFKEAIRSRLFWVFLLFLLPWLFPVKWFLPLKPEDELRTTISVSSFWAMILILLPAALLAAFSIPNDIKNQNIYTIVTKPVERFEIVVGRFFGYVVLMTMALVGMTAIGWLFILAANPDNKAREETYMARMPVRGSIAFESRRGTIDGTNVGREFDYRRYIGGDPSTSQRAIWSFPSIPLSLTQGRESVPCEFTFDIYRMTKGQENRGVDLEIRVCSWKCPQIPPMPGEPATGKWGWQDKEQEARYKQEAAAELTKLGMTAGDPTAVFSAAKPGTPVWVIANQLAEKYGFFEVVGKEVFDYHPAKIDVPVGLFAGARSGEPPTEPGKPPTPRVKVFVKCTTSGQMLGMAEGDLYFLENDPVPSHWQFAQNYFKSAFGLWCLVCLVIGLAVTCSTYLAGIISFLAAAFLFLAGYFSDHLADMASGRSHVGGPGRAILSLMEAKPPTNPLDKTNPLTDVAGGFDTGFSWIIRRFVNLVPDIQGYTWNHFLSEGFNIPAEYLAMNGLVLAGYLLPWFILGFYLIRSREVAA